MSLQPKTIAVFLDPTPAGRQRARQAASLAQRWGAHLVGIHVVFAGAELPPSMSYARGQKALAQVVEYKQQRDDAAECIAAELREHFRVLCEGLDVSEEFHPIGRDHDREEALEVALHSDLVVVGQPGPCGLPEPLSLEKLLLKSGAPLLIVPTAWEGETIGSRILIGWNGAREARRAVIDAMAFLTTAQSVAVLTIDPEPSAARVAGQGQHPPIVPHLYRHGVHAAYQHTTSNGFSVAALLFGYAEENGSDLLVVGAYSHARLREALFGGTTRTLLAHTPIPTFISR